MEVYINPMIDAGVLEMTEPDNPTSRNQMYVTVKVEQELQKQVYNRILRLGRLQLHTNNTARVKMRAVLFGSSLI